MAQRYPDEYNRLDSLHSDSPELLETFEVIPQAKCDHYRRCRIRLPASLILLCYCEDTGRRHTELLRITELPETVRHLKQLISDIFHIPIICQLQLSVKEMQLFDDQYLSQDVSLREGDQLKLVYFGRCSSDKLVLLVKQGTSISNFCNNYIEKNAHIRTLSNTIKSEQRKSTFSKFIKKAFRIGKATPPTPAPQFIGNATDDRQGESPRHLIKANQLQDANFVKWCLNKMYCDILLPWKDEGTLCQRLYLVQEELVDRIIQVWHWSLNNSEFSILRACMLTFWDFGENWAERMYLFNRKVHVMALNVFLNPRMDEETRGAALGLIAGFGEFPQGQKAIGTNISFLEGIAQTFRDTNSSFMATVIGGLLLSLASCHFIPRYMLRAKILEKLKPDIDEIDFTSVQDMELTYTLILFFMYLLKSPDFQIPQVYSVQIFIKCFEDFSKYNDDQALADSEEEKQTSWASMVPFLDLFFISKDSPLVKESVQETRLMTSYLQCARILLSAMLMQEDNRRLFLDEDLYGYLVFLSWHFKNDRSIGPLMVQLISRFQPAPFKIPSLLHLATAQYAFEIKGLGHAIEYQGADTLN